MPGLQRAHAPAQTVQGVVITGLAGDEHVRACIPGDLRVTAARPAQNGDTRHVPCLLPVAAHHAAKALGDMRRQGFQRHLVDIADPHARLQGDRVADAQAFGKRRVDAVFRSVIVRMGGNHGNPGAHETCEQAPLRVKRGQVLPAAEQNGMMRNDQLRAQRLRLPEHGFVQVQRAEYTRGLDDLLEMVALVAEMKELKANPDRAAKGTVIEARLDKGRGPIATVLVQNGTLHKGDIIIAGTTVGRVRVMTNDKGERVQEAGPSVPVEITGLDEVPVGGDTFDAVSDERLARTLVEQRKSQTKEEIFNAQTKVTLDNLFDQLRLGEVKELQIIVKADVQGSVEAVRQSLEKLSNEEVRVNVIHGAVGAINESDVMLAEASSAIIVGFNVRPDAVAASHAESAGVDMRLYSVIYDCINEIEAAMKGMLAPKTREVVLGMAECRNVIKIKSVGTIAGSYVKSGKIQRGGGVRVIRDGIVIAEDHIGSLQRFKDAVKEVNEGYECGIGLEKFNDLKEGDMFEVYTIEEYRD